MATNHTHREEKVNVTHFAFFELRFADENFILRRLFNYAFFFQFIRSRLKISEA